MTALWIAIGSGFVIYAACRLTEAGIFPNVVIW